MLRCANSGLSDLWWPSPAGPENPNVLEACATTTMLETKWKHSLGAMKKTEPYKLRYFFDPGSGICLWSENDLARNTFGYPVDLSSLDLPALTKAQAQELIAQFDTSIDWSDPTAPSPWTDETRAQFEIAAARLLGSLRECLGVAFVIRDCSR